MLHAAILTTIVVAGCAGRATAVRDPAPCDAYWRLAYQHDTHGKDLRGSRADLVAAMERGSPLRVAWGVQEPDGRSVVEFAEPVFTSLMNGRDIVIQFESAFIQTDYLDPTKATFRLPPLAWHGLISTDGRFDAFMVDIATGNVERRLAQRVNASWYVHAPPPACDARPRPALAVPGAIVPDPAPPPTSRAKP